MLHAIQAFWYNTPEVKPYLHALRPLPKLTCTPGCRGKDCESGWHQDVAGQCLDDFRCKKSSPAWHVIPFYHTGLNCHKAAEARPWPWLSIPFYCWQSILLLTNCSQQLETLTTKSDCTLRGPAFPGSLFDLRFNPFRLWASFTSFHAGHEWDPGTILCWWRCARARAHACTEYPVPWLEARKCHDWRSGVRKSTWNLLAVLIADMAITQATDMCVVIMLRVCIIHRCMHMRQGVGMERTPCCHKKWWNHQILSMSFQWSCNSNGHVIPIVRYPKLGDMGSPCNSIHKFIPFIIKWSGIQSSVTWDLPRSWTLWPHHARTPFAGPLDMVSNIWFEFDCGWFAKASLASGHACTAQCWGSFLCRCHSGCEGAKCFSLWKARHALRSCRALLESAAALQWDLGCASLKAWELHASLM